MCVVFFCLLASGTRWAILLMVFDECDWFAHYVYRPLAMTRAEVDWNKLEDSDPCLFGRRVYYGVIARESRAMLRESREVW